MIKSSDNLEFYPSRAGLKKALLGDTTALSELTAAFVDDSQNIFHRDSTKRQKGYSGPRVVEKMM